MTPDYQESLRFLRAVYPRGPWTLTAISVDKKHLDTRTFSGDAEADEVLAWLSLNGKRNLYWSVNEVTEEARTLVKAKKENIRLAHFVHVDVDPRDGEDLEEEQRRIRALIDSYDVKPSVVVFSGGGYNALWRLTRPVPISEGAASHEEVIARAIDFERRNWQMELDFDTTDHCRDVCRILRLPGTLNRPDAKKAERGRVTALSRVVEITDRAYDLEEFRCTPHVGANVASTGTKVLGDAQRVTSLDELGKKVPDKLKVIIAQGFDPDDPKRWGSDRSAVLFYVCCELVRHDVPDEVILGVITDPRFLISESVLDKGSGVMRYAVRQVERARDHADHPMLEEMNREFAVILSYGNTTVVMVEEGRMNVQTGQPEPVFQSFRTFKDRIKHYPKIPVQVGDKVKHLSAFEWWTSHPRRREFRDVTFEPGLDTPGRYNLYGGFSVQPVKGDGHARWLEHVYENICDRDDQSYEYLLRWMGRVVQQPRTQSMVAPVLIGERGTGKSVFTDTFSLLFAPHRYTASDVNELTGKFNAHLGQCVVVVAEEAFDLRDKRHTSVLKELITGRTIGIERKGVDRVLMPNYVHLIMTSNPDSAGNRIVPAGDHERRFFVLRVGNGRRQQNGYFAQICRERDDGGLSNLLHYLMDLSLDGFDVGDFPRTEALREQQEHNLSYELEWLLEKLESGQWLRGGSVPWRGPVKKRDLHTDYQAFMQSVGARNVKGARAFHKFVMQTLPGTTDQQSFVKGEGRPMVFQFPPLDRCREVFDEARGWRSNWPRMDDSSEKRDAEVLVLRSNDPA